jgi:phage shock protein E
LKPIYIGFLIAALGIVLSIATRSKAESVPPGTVFDQVIDVRTADEFRENQVKGAINIDVLEKSFRDKISKLDRTKSYAVYCRSGARSSNAKSIMTGLGFKNVINLGSVEQAKKSLEKKGE